ncbi:methyl-accepting chemotaxis protein [Alginatibacterium sediminis]|uniref:Methyl-accepting chemotaxis protein n=1 Tax=Alginatibacterium sediminis TaxID=2164068 RepID=A0A420E7W0_9ALTE|nr:methyl-accepting chemotaxis protein [Alginatibacterium sediminis]
MSFKGKVFGLFVLIVTLSVLTSYFATNYFVSAYVNDSTVKSIEAQMALIKGKVEGDVQSKILLASNIDTGSDSLDALQANTGFYKIYKIISGIVFTDEGTVSEGPLVDSMIPLLDKTVNGVYLSELEIVEDKPILTLVVASSETRADIFRIDLNDVSALLAAVSKNGAHLSLRDQSGTAVYANDFTDEHLTFDMPIDVQGQQWNLSALIEVAVIEDRVSALNSSITIALLVSGLVLIALSIAAFFMAYAPVRNLRDVVGSLADGEGDLTQRLEVKGSGELGEMATSINAFVESLQVMVKKVMNSSEVLGQNVQQINTQTFKNQDLLNDHVQETELAIAAITEMSATAASVAENAVGAAQLTDLSTQSAEQCQAQVNESVDSMGQLVGQVDDMSKSISALSTDIENIGSILGVIGGIADQTNLLALNAAIEAARAGEQGRGFAVVADEVRTLANQTQNSTKEINAMLSQIQAGTASVVTAMESTRIGCLNSAETTSKSSESLNALLDSIAELSGLNSQIATAAEEQSAVTNEISENMSKIQMVVQDLQQNGQATQSDVEALEQTKTSLAQLVGHFKTQ